MAEVNARDSVEVMVEKLTAELMALKVYVASIGTEVPLQGIRNMLNRSKQAAEPHYVRRRRDTAHKVLDELDGLAGEFKEQRRLFRSA
jgi:hypothetical protein